MLKVAQLFLLSRLDVLGFSQAYKKEPMHLFSLVVFGSLYIFNLFPAFYTFLLYMYSLPKNLVDLLQF